ncbi:MAG: family transcriptional regulator, cyclic receptor protein [Solirubrobacteraceae bacterium]|nr:family transcriptional regulator, cyclic receptor protein [Solirubrobacteraceae bacterium]
MNTAMHPHDAESVDGPAPVWSTPTEPRVETLRARPPTSYCYLLDVDKDLADEFDQRMRIVVRRIASVPVFDAPVGECDLRRWFDPGPESLGLLVLDGVIAFDVRVGTRTATELVGTGDLLQPWSNGDEQLIDRIPAWRVLLPTRIAVLDGAFTERVRPWPQLGRALLRRVGRRARDLDVQRAIMCQPRLEVRLALLFWHLAERWGRVEPSGIHVSLPLTHSLLGRLAGAERPSISHALARLADAGLVTGAAGHWHLHGGLDDQLAQLQRPVERLPHRAASGAAAPRS